MFLCLVIHAYSQWTTCTCRFVWRSEVKLGYSSSEAVYFFFPSSFSIFHVCVCSMCVWTQECTKRFRVMSGFMLSCSSYSVRQSLSQTRSPIWLVLLASLLWGFCFCLDRLELQAGWHVHPAFPVGFWGLALHAKHFNCWTIFPPHQSPTLFFYFYLFIFIFNFNFLKQSLSMGPELCWPTSELQRSSCFAQC